MTPHICHICQSSHVWHTPPPKLGKSDTKKIGRIGSEVGLWTFDAYLHNDGDKHVLCTCPYTVHVWTGGQPSTVLFTFLECGVISSLRYVVSRGGSPQNNKHGLVVTKEQVFRYAGMLWFFQDYPVQGENDVISTPPIITHHGEFFGIKRSKKY